MAKKVPFVCQHVPENAPRAYKRLRRREGETRKKEEEEEEEEEEEARRWLRISVS